MGVGRGAWGVGVRARDQREREPAHAPQRVAPARCRRPAHHRGSVRLPRTTLHCRDCGRRRSCGGQLACSDGRYERQPGDAQYSSRPRGGSRTERDGRAMDEEHGVLPRRDLADASRVLRMAVWRIVLRRCSRRTPGGAQCAPVAALVDATFHPRVYLEMTSQGRRATALAGGTVRATSTRKVR